MKSRLFLLCGILAPVVYMITVIVGGGLRPGYSHVSQAVSDLIASGAPNKSLLDPLFALYNLLAIAFGLGRFNKCVAPIIIRENLPALWVRSFWWPKAYVGFLRFSSPKKLGLAATITGTGKMHIVFAGLCSLTSMLALLLMGFWLRNSPRLRRYGLYSFISVIAVFLSGGLAAVSVASHSPVGGLVERITNGGFLQWLFVIALLMYSTEVTRAKQNTSGPVS